MNRAALVAVLALLAPACGGGPSESEKEAAVAAAQDAYQEAIDQGVDMSNGPCLGVIMDNWVADVAHEPREEIDDDPANQCEAYRKGEADHYVELDLNGDVIRAE
jgi:hypothetical protein